MTHAQATLAPAPGRLGTALGRARTTAATGVGRARPVVAAVLGRVRPVVGVVGPVGWLTLGATVAGLWAAHRFGWVEVWSLALAGAALLVVAVALSLGRSAYAVRIDLARHRVVVGTRAVGAVHVRNTSRRGLLPARVELPVGASVASFRLPRLAAGADHEDPFTIPTRRRGVLVVGPVSSVRGDPLGLVRREVRWTDPIELFVHPRTVSLDGSAAGLLRDIEGLPTQELSSNDVAFHALREYVAGDDRRSIHWKTTARTGRLMVRQFEETRRSHLAVSLSTSVGDFADDDEFELAVSVCGSLGLQAIKEEKEVSVLVPGGRVRTATSQRFLDGLSTLERSPSVDGIVALARSTVADVPDASAVVLVVGTAVTPASLRAAASHVPVGVTTIALRCAPGAAIGRRLLGGLVVLTVGALEDLPRAMRRVGA